MNTSPRILIMMGSESDLPVMQETKKILSHFEVPCEMHIASAHRSPQKAAKLATEAAGRGIKVVIAAAGMAAHLAGVVASKTVLPVIGVPMPGGALNGVDALYSTVQMPGGIPVASMAIGKAGAKNAALFAVQILALEDQSLGQALLSYRRQMEEEIENQDIALQQHNDRS